MRLLTILPWAIALGLVSYTKPALSRAVAPSDSDSSVAAAAIALAPGAFTASQSQHNVHPATSRRDRRHIENRYVSRHAYDQRDKLAGVPDKKDANIKDDYWDDRVNAGCNLLAAMNSDDKAAAFYVGQEGSAESAWKNYADLESWGWMADDVAKGILSMSGLQLKDAFTDLGLNTGWINLKNNPEISVDAQEHFDDCEHDGVKYQGTDAHFYTVMQMNKGVLVGWQKFGPAHSAFHKAPPHQGSLPKLKNWHDIAFLQWKKQAEAEKADISNIRYIVSTAIINNESQFIVGRALKIPNRDKKGRPDSEWQIARGAECGNIPWSSKVTFDATSDEGKALIATPNGRGAALMLITHKSTFGAKRTIDKVTVWCEGGAMNFMFRVKEKQEEEPEDPDKPSQGDSLDDVLGDGPP